jgi:hypothetical protein
MLKEHQDRTVDFQAGTHSHEKALNVADDGKRCPDASHTKAQMECIEPQQGCAYAPMRDGVDLHSSVLSTSTLQSTCQCAVCPVTQGTRSEQQDAIGQNRDLLGVCIRKRHEHAADVVSKRGYDGQVDTHKCPRNEKSCGHRSLGCHSVPGTCTYVRTLKEPKRAPGIDHAYTVMQHAERHACMRT